MQASQLDPKLPLPRLGLAQMSVLGGEAINAVSILESVLLDAPHWIDALEVRAQGGVLGVVGCVCLPKGGPRLCGGYPAHVMGGGGVGTLGCSPMP